ncbi:MAG: hypothetical protein ACP5TL_01625 [Candidatus Micrarchaeia archaeon]
MKVQTTLEFIILLAAVASFSTVLLSIYSGFVKGQKSTFSVLSNSLNEKQGNASIYIKPSSPFFVDAIIQNTTYVGIESTMQGVLYIPQNATVLILKASSSNAAVEPSEYHNISSGIYVLPFKVIPLKPGQIILNLTAIVDYPNAQHVNNVYALTYATMPNGTSGASDILISIDRIYESTNYGLNMLGNIQNISVSSHCSYVNIWGNELPLKEECGNTASWYLWVGSWYCTWLQGSQSDTLTYCFYSHSSNDTVYSIDTNSTYSYNITLDLHEGNLSLSANLSNGSTKAPLESDNVAYGSASISNVSGLSYNPGHGYFVIGKPEGKCVVNASTYLLYQQTLLNVQDALAYYNNTSPDSSTLSSLLQKVNALDSEANKLYNTKCTSIENCLAGSNTVSCKPLPYLYYVINANIIGSGTYQTDYEGSTIKVS